MNFLNAILQRPENERPFLQEAVGGHRDVAVRHGSAQTQKWCYSKHGLQRGAAPGKPERARHFLKSPGKVTS
jgi:hypothetical protein